MSTSHSVHARARADHAGRGAEEEYVGCCPPRKKKKRANKVPRSSRESPSKGLGRVRAGEDEGMKSLAWPRCAKTPSPPYTHGEKHQQL